jgi:phosphoribosylanthranilate isomerase
MKFCGITTIPDAEHAVRLGAWAIGLIFASRSSRRCPRDVAAKIAATVRRRIEVVGVFVDAPLDDVVGLSESVGLTAIQLHGAEGPAYCAEVARRTGCATIRAVRVRSRADLQSLRRYPTNVHLLDSTGGAPFDWDLVAQHRGATPLVVGGALTPDNVDEAIAATRPWAVDVASGVEAAPGRKDHRRMDAFAAAVRAAGRRVPVS